MSRPLPRLAPAALLALSLAAVPARAAPPTPAERLGPAWHAAAREALRSRAAAWGLSPAGAGAAELAGLHDPGEGPVVVAWRRPVAGVEVLGEQAAVVLDRRGAPVATLGALSSLRPAPGAAFALPPEGAAARALAAVAGVPASPADLVPGRASGPWSAFAVRPAAEAARPALAGATARARRLWQPAGGSLWPIWAVEVEAPRRADPEGRAQVALVSAEDGRLLALHSLAREEAHAYRVWAEAGAPWRPGDGPNGFAGTPHPTGLPDGWQAPAVPQTLVTLDHAFSTAAGDPWLPPGATGTVGNNADVYADTDGLDGWSPPGDVRGRLTGPLAFDWTADLSADPTAEANRQAALVQAFYTVNFLHDWFYEAGFDEAAGNMQFDNYGRGGLAGDQLLVEVQDSAIANNAYLSSRADGGSPRLSVGIYGAVTPRYVAWVSPTPEAVGRPVREEATRSAFGRQSFDETAGLVAVDDGAGSGADACDDTAWATDVAGRIALVDAAGCLGAAAACSCSAKALLAQARGAVGVLMANDAAGYLFLSLAPADPGVTVPVLGLTSAVGAAFRTALATGPVTARMVRGPPAPRRDGALDTLIVAHEWGHALSGRLVHDALGLFTHQSRALGEGWADFVALLLAVREEDAAGVAGAPFGGVYASSSWTMGGAEGLFGGPNQAWYFGTRRVPYSTDFTRNALTLRHIVRGEPPPLTTPGGAAIPFADNGLQNDEVHNAGEVWATMLWECYAALLRDTVGATPRLTFAEAQARMKRYLVASLKATPFSPTFIEARDALVQVALAGDPADGARFWQALARRGAGEGASCGALDSPDNGPVVESYLSPYPEPEPPPPPPPPPPAAGSPGDGGGCQAGGAGPLALLAVAEAFRRLRRRRSRAGLPGLPGGPRRIA